MKNNQTVTGKEAISLIEKHGIEGVVDHGNGGIDITGEITKHDIIAADRFTLHANYPGPCFLHHDKENVSIYLDASGEFVDGEWGLTMAANQAKKVSDLAELVSEKEAELAYGSETCLLGAFVNEYGFVDEAKQNDTTISDEDYQLWVDAYEKYEELEAAGEDFNVSDCF
jgi:hypothetical protein